MADQFCLKWNNYQLSLTSAFKHLLEEEDFVDVTLSAEGKSLKAHKVVLSACSTYFRWESINLMRYGACCMIRYDQQVCGADFFPDAGTS